MNHSSERTLAQWLAYLEQGQAGGVIDMGLERVRAVKERMNLQPRCPIVTVAGTNGKGSVCAFLTAIYREAGFRVGTLTSPHLLRFNERIALNGEPADDAAIVAAFERIEAARGDIALTYFEFNTLAAVDVFMRAEVDVMVLEVGLGGRLDAVNVFDADVAAVVSVDVDHQAFLGDTVEAVAYEKAGVFRHGKPAICGQNPPPHSLAAYAAEIGAPLLVAGRDFTVQSMDNQQWSFRFHPQSFRLLERARHALPMPALRGAYQLHNAACALSVIECLNTQLPIDIGAIKRGLLMAVNAGRFQVLPGRPLRVWDVGHNPHAARALKNSLQRLPFAQKRTAVFSILADKDMAGVVSLLDKEFDEWLIAPLDLPRGRSVDNMLQVFAQVGIERRKIHAFDSVPAAWAYALSTAGEDDRIVLFGSFHTVAEVAATHS
ncbi:MAG: bifunctional tetrahydrofolate synthase/dihydrofolate synthase [Neisseria sp.]|nr:bifunctional tetrahydrofolate synthase/dihydrofolate synthase [Neisseria sp.]